MSQGAIPDGAIVPIEGGKLMTMLRRTIKTEQPRKMIARGFARVNVSSYSQKAHARRTRYEEVYVADKAHKHQRFDTQTNISFGKEDQERVLYPHNDALVVTLLVSNTQLGGYWLTIAVQQIYYFGRPSSKWVLAPKNLDPPRHH